MRHLMPDSSELTGSDSNHRSVGTVPSGMDNDPYADETVINQQAGEEYPKPVEEDSSTKLTSDNLADSIAYALDGSGPGITGDKPNVSGHDVITEGTTGAGPEEEDSLFGK